MAHGARPRAATTSDQPINACANDAESHPRQYCRAEHEIITAAHIFLRQGGAVVLIFVLLLCALLFKNLFGKEEILFLKAGAPAGSATTSAIMCDDLIAIEHRPPPMPMTADGKMAMLGLGGERLMLFTKAGAYPFGIGLSDVTAAAAINQIEKFCARPLLRPAKADQR